MAGPADREGTGLGEHEAASLPHTEREPTPMATIT